MATVVGFRSGHLRSWTGSLSELNSCGCLTDDFSNGMTDCPSPSYLGWRNECHFSPTRSPPSSVVGMADTSLSSPDWPDVQSRRMKQCWNIRNFLNAIPQNWRTQGQVTTKQLKHIALIPFSSVLDREGNTQDDNICLSCFTAPNMLISHASSETELPRYSEFQSGLLFHDHQGFKRLLKQTRRHCNSESDLAGPLSSISIIDCDKESNFINESTTPLEAKANFDPKLDASAEEWVKPASSNVLEDYFESSTTGQSGAESEIESLEHEFDTLIATDIETDTFALESQSCAKVDQHYSITESVYTEIAVNLDESNLPEMTLCELRSPTSTEEKPSGTSTVCSTPIKLSKSVSFADEVGQELAEIFLIESNDYDKFLDYDSEQNGTLLSNYYRPRFPENLSSNRFTRSRLKQRSTLFEDDPILAKPAASTVKSSFSKLMPFEPTRNLWVLCFPQPAAQYYEFRQRVEKGAVSLENIVVTQPDENSTSKLPQLAGTVKVKNLSYEKQVWLRLTTDNWQSFTDYVALYSAQLSGGLLHSASRFDTFSFQIGVVPQMETSQMCDKIEFAIRYMVGSGDSWGQYWDNNGGKNYMIERRTVQSSWPSQLVDPTSSHSSASSVAVRSSACSASFDGISDVNPNTQGPLHPYTPDYRPNFEGITQFTDYRAWSHFANETTYY